jgi:transposase
MGHNRRHELIDQQWKLLEPLLAKRKKEVDLWRIVYVLKTGCAWADIPKSYGSYLTCWRRLKQWQKDRTAERIWRKLLRQCDEQQKFNWDFCFLDGTFVSSKKGAMLSK